MKRPVVFAVLALLFTTGFALHAEEPVATPEAPAEAPPPTAGKAAKAEKFAAHDIEVRLKDGSSLRGELKGTDAVVLKTSFGDLKFPIDDIYQLTHAPENSAADREKIAVALKNFQGADAGLQRAAEAALCDAGNAAVEPLFDLRQGVAPDLKPRIDALLRRVLALKADPAASADCIRTAKFEARGVLQLGALKLSGKLGELSIKLAEIDSVRWLAHGILKTIDMDAEPTVHDWLDTGIDANLGESVTVSAGGHVVLFGSVQAEPAGNSGGDAQPFPMGAVIGRVGPDGESFLIGESKNWKPENAGRLYLRIAANEDVLQGNQQHSRGHYSVRIATGPWSDDNTAAPPTEGQ